MAGHSKWANIKHRKGRQDAKRGKTFGKLIRAIEVAARAGGTSDPDMNPPLALAIQKAKDADVPKDTFERAAKRGAGELGDAAAYEPVQYEGYAPGGIAVLVDCLTDNRNRTAADVRSAFTKSGGSLAEPGSVSFLFSRRGQVVLTAPADAEDELLMVGLDAGLADLEQDGGTFTAWCDAADVPSLRAAFEEAGFRIESAGSTMVPSSTVDVADAAEAKKILRLLDELDDNDDVQDVYANFDIADEVLEAVGAEG
ncbi:MAG: YebC/PmpR family DNA-binding transcriptional regulator [Nitriliruptorales bacterium]|nr:YebC/PmpR family DNA-binding transcriptional regulator [Nitriliruptorales bacterium]